MEKIKTLQTRALGWTQEKHMSLKFLFMRKSKKEDLLSKAKHLHVIAKTAKEIWKNGIWKDIIDEERPTMGFHTGQISFYRAILDETQKEDMSPDTLDHLSNLLNNKEKILEHIKKRELPKEIKILKEEYHEPDVLIAYFKKYCSKETEKEESS
ncbi:hypothetical protein KAW38_01140 [Candidatus Micrarchaeota archaeon]|nr:hypothetical protein [Candidatus Micrarchaeota archaeon]